MQLEILKDLRVNHSKENHPELNEFKKDLTA